MERFLRASEEDAIFSKVRAISAILHERPELFQRQLNIHTDIVAEQHLYLRPISHAIQLDGYAEDWQDLKDRFQGYGKEHLLMGEIPGKKYSFDFRHATGSYNGYLYAIFDVTDKNIVYRNPNTLRLDQSDHLQIGLQTPKGAFERYILTTSAPGWVNAHLMPADTGNPIPLHPETRIKGEWQETSTGYILEIRIPLSMIGEKIAFAIANVDDRTKREVRTLIGTSSTKSSNELGTIVVPSPEIEEILGNLTENGGRIWLIDRNRRVLAINGSLKNLTTTRNLPREEGIISNIMRPLYRIFLKQPVQDFEDELSGVSKLKGREIESALKGKSATSWRSTPDKLTSILTATHPVIAKDSIVGAVMLEQTSNRILIFQNRAMENLLNRSILVFLGVLFVLLIFATRLSLRITKLRDDTENAISPDGKINHSLPKNDSGDEIGDLARSFSDLLKRLGQYNRYLESMAGKLSHELRTPVSIVRSSLENLQIISRKEAEESTYIDRALEGTERLNNIINRMSEATRLEQSLQSSEKEIFNLHLVLEGCIEGFKSIYPHQEFIYQSHNNDTPVEGSPDLIAQMMDKLISNAVDFSENGTPISVKLEKSTSTAIITVSNIGRPLPDEMQHQLFDSMVSVRDKKGDKQAHLGLGLHIVRLIADFHDGSVSACNMEENKGAIFQVQIPLAKNS